MASERVTLGLTDQGKLSTRNSTNSGINCEKNPDEDSLEAREGRTRERWHFVSSRRLDVFRRWVAFGISFWKFPFTWRLSPNVRPGLVRVDPVVVRLLLYIVERCCYCCFYWVELMSSCFWFLVAAYPSDWHQTQDGSRQSKSLRKLAKKACTRQVLRDREGLPTVNCWVAKEKFFNRNMPIWSYMRLPSKLARGDPISTQNVNLLIGIQTWTASSFLLYVLTRSSLMQLQICLLIRLFLGSLLMLCIS